MTDGHISLIELASRVVRGCWLRISIARRKNDWLTTNSNIKADIQGRAGKGSGRCSCKGGWVTKLSSWAATM
jgi:hypothetical protein